jgi:hypothetical protein
MGAAGVSIIGIRVYARPHECACAAHFSDWPFTPMQQKTCDGNYSVLPMPYASDSMDL